MTEPTNRLAGLKIDFGGGSPLGTGAPLGGISLVQTPDASPITDGPADALEEPGRTESKVLIIGSGPAGLTAAIYAARANLQPIVLAGSAPGGQLMLTSEVENYPGFPDGIDGPDLMGRMRAQAERFATVFVDQDVERVDLSARPFRAWARGIEYRGESLIIATGATAIWLELESEQRLRGRGVSACATCDGFFFRDREIAVVGGGDSAMEEANYLTRFASKVHLLHRRDGFRASKIMIDRTYGNPKIQVHTNTEVAEVLGEAKVEGLRLRDARDGSVRDLPLQGLFIAIGHRPNTAAFKTWLDTDEKGYLLPHEHTSSRIPGVFIAGDVADHRYRQAVTAAGDGARAAIDAEHWLEEMGRSNPHERVGRDRVTFRGGGVRALARGAAGPGRLTPPSNDFVRVPRERRGSTARRVARFFGPYRGQVLVVLGAILATSLLGLINPYLLKLLIDDVIVGHRFELLNGYVALMIVLPIGTGLLGVGQSYLNNLIGQHVMQDLRNALYAHLQNMPLRFFTATRTGEIQSRLSNDVGGVQSVVTDTAASVTQNVAVALSTIVAMILIDWRLTALSLGVLPFFLYLTNRVGKVRRSVSTETQKRLAELTAVTEETLSVSGMLLGKTFGAQDRNIARFRGLNLELARLQIRQAMVGRWFFMITGTVFSITPAFVYWLAGTLARGGDASAPSAGDIVAFTTLQSRLFFPMGQLLNVQVEIAGSLALFDRIFEYLDLDPEIADAPDAHELVTSAVAGAVAFEHVSFRYPADPPREIAADIEADAEAEPDVGADLATEPAEPIEPIAPFGLEDVSFEALPGELVALVGPSGAGKTTTTYLIPRIYDVAEGRVTVDGHDVRSVTLASLGRVIGSVTQETYLFHTTIRENLLYAKPEATQAEMESACGAAAIMERIRELPDGLDTVVGERGYKLSGGEKQRLAIARVLLKDPKILILDEATSSLDTVSERLIQAALARLTEGRTTIAIAHRLSTILRADRILVFERGRIVERGTHRELLAAEGLYSRLYHEQFEAEAAALAEMGAGR